MEYEVKELDCEVVGLNLNTEQDYYMWDLGFVRLLGNSEKPFEYPSGYKIFSIMASDEDYIERETISKTLDLYMGDYVCYVETTPDRAEYFLGDEMYFVEEILDSEDGSFAVVRVVSGRNPRKTLIPESDLEDMVPLMILSR